VNSLIRNITIENQKINREQFFAIGYCPEIEKHLLCVHISWIAGYDRYGGRRLKYAKETE